MIKKIISIAIASASIGSPVFASQFPDVSPENWAYQAILNLKERYGCASGYPSGTFKPGQPATRAEMAALVNACLDNITQFYTEADARSAAALRAEFSRELASTNSRVSALELAAAQKAQGVGNYLGAAATLTRQGVEGNGYDANRTIFGGAIQGRYAVRTFSNQNAVSVRPYVNFASGPNNQFGTAGGTLISYDFSLARAVSGVSKSNLYLAAGYQVPFINNSEVNYQSSIGSKGQAVLAVGLESRLTNTLSVFGDVKFPTTNAANSYGVTGGSYSPTLNIGAAFKL